MITNHKIGQRSEVTVCAYLKRHGLKLVTSNYRGPHGEIDLIMRDKGCLTFIEVRYRNCTDYGRNVETITHSKRRRLILTAQHYLQQNNLLDTIQCRFDAIGINSQGKIIWIKNAFEVEY